VPWRREGEQCPGGGSGEQCVLEEGAVNSVSWRRER
jgi:hypothetical protein